MFNSLPNDKMLDLSKLKASTDNKINVAENVKFVVERVENIVGKGKNTSYRHFLLFPLCFQWALSSRSLKVGIEWENVSLGSQYLFRCITSTNRYLPNWY